MAWMSTTLELATGRKVQIKYREGADDQNGESELLWSCRDLYDAAAHKAPGGAWNQDVMALLRAGPQLPPGLGTMGWEDSFTEVLQTAKAREDGQELWIRPHAVGAVLWQLVAHYVSPSTRAIEEQNARKMRGRVQDVIASFGRQFAAGRAPLQGEGQGGAGAPIVPLVDSADTHAGRLEHKWGLLYERVGRDSGVRDPVASPILMGRTLAKLVDRDAGARAAALREGGLGARALRALEQEGLRRWQEFLHAVKITFSCSLAMMLQVAALARPLLLHYAVPSGTSTKLVARVKKGVADSRENQTIIRTTFRSKGTEAVGVALGARSWFEHLMSTPTIRAAIMIEGDCLRLAFSFDARTLAKVPWWNTLYGLKFVQMLHTCNRSDDYYCFGHYDGKEDPAQILLHGQDFFVYLDELRRNGYDDSARDSDCALMQCLRTGLKKLKVEVLGTADRAGMQVMLWGPRAFAFHCSVYSTITQPSLVDLGTYFPVSKVLGLWNEAWNKGIDRDQQKKFSKGEAGGLMGMDSRSAPPDVLHLKINTLVKLFRRLGLLVDAVGSCEVPGCAGFAGRVENYWKKDLHLKIYRMGEEEAFLSTNVRGSLQFISLHDRAFRVPGAPVLPEDACYILDKLLLQYLKVFDAIVEQRKGVDLVALHVDAHVLGKLVSLLFSRRFCTQTVRTLTDNIAFCVARCEEIGTNLNCLSLQSLEAQHRIHRAALYRITARRHTHATLETVLRASEEAKLLKESSQEIPHVLEAAKHFAEKAEDGVRLPKEGLEATLLLVLDSVSPGGKADSKARETGLGLIKEERAMHHRWGGRRFLFFCEFMSLVLESLRVPVMGGDSLSACIRSLRNEERYFREDPGASSNAPNITRSVARGRVRRAGGGGISSGGGDGGGGVGGEDEEGGNVGDGGEGGSDSEGEGRGSDDEDEREAEDGGGGTISDGESDENEEQGGQGEGDDEGEDDPVGAGAGAGGAEGGAEESAAAAALLRKMTALTQLQTSKEAKNVRQTMSSMSCGNLCVGSRTAGDLHGMVATHNVCTDDVGPVEFKWQHGHDTSHTALIIVVRVRGGTEFRLRFLLSSVMALVVEALSDDGGFVVGIDLAQAPAVTRRCEGDRKWRKLAAGEQLAQSIVNLCAEGAPAVASTPPRTGPRMVLESRDAAAMQLVTDALLHARSMSSLEVPDGHGEPHFASTLPPQPPKSFRKSQLDEQPLLAPPTDPITSAAVDCLGGRAQQLTRLKNDVQALLTRERSSFTVTCSTCKLDFRVEELHGVRQVCTDFVEPAIGQIVIDAGGEGVHGTVTGFDPVKRVHTIVLPGGVAPLQWQASRLKLHADQAITVRESKIRAELSKRFPCPAAGCKDKSLRTLPVLLRHIQKKHADFSIENDVEDTDPLHNALRAQEMKAAGKKRKFVGGGDCEEGGGSCSGVTLARELGGSVLEVGTEVEVLADDGEGQQDWWKAKLVRVPTARSVKDGRQEDEFKIHYHGSPASDDEWIELSSDRIRLPVGWGEMWNAQQVQAGDAEQTPGAS